MVAIQKMAPNYFMDQVRLSNLIGWLAKILGLRLH